MTTKEIKALKKDLRPGMIEFMRKKDPGKSDSTYQTYVSDSNYLLNNDAVDEYLRFVRSDEDMPEIQELIRKIIIEHRGIEKLKTGDVYYYEKLCWHREYIKVTGGIDKWLEGLYMEKQSSGGIYFPKEDQNERYEKINPLGNKGKVFLMDDHELNCSVVRKTVSEDVYKIYKNLAQNDFPYITEITDCESINGKFYIYEKYIDGKTIQNKVEEEGILPLETAIKYAIQILEGLSRIHSINIIHKDITPNNMIVDYEDNIHIIDFDISRVHKPNKNQDTTFLGTPGFASPEHYYGISGQTDERSDLYSVGKVLRFMLTGDSESEKNFDDSRIQKVIEKAIETDKKNRYQSAIEMKKAIESIDYKLKQAVSFPLYDESDDIENIVKILIDYMEAEGIRFKTRYISGDSSYAIMPSLSSVGYRRKDGIVIFAGKDGIDKSCFEVIMKKSYENNSQNARPYKFVFSKEEFPQAVKCLIMNPDNCL